MQANEKSNEKMIKGSKKRRMMPLPCRPLYNA